MKLPNNMYSSVFCSLGMHALVLSGWCHDSGTSAVRTLIPAIGAVRDPVAQFAHMNAEISSSTLVLVGRAP